MGMLYRLYANIGGFKVIDISHDEKDIVDSMKECVKNHSQIYFMIRLQTENEDILYQSICNESDYNKYLQDFEQRQEKIEKIKKLK